jgi:hypothetical protein
METTQTYSEAPSFETIREMLSELAASQKETDRQMKESAARLDKQLSKLGSRIGDIVEHLVSPNLAEKFNELGFVFDKTHQNTVIKDKNKKTYTEIDVTLENGDKVMIVEVKTKLTIEDIKDHIERMNKVRAHADKNGDKRKYLGAVAGAVITDNERNFAFKNGFYVIEPAGETFTIKVPEGDYSIREW